MAKAPNTAELTEGDIKFIKGALRDKKTAAVRNETKARAAGQDGLADAHQTIAENCDMIARKL